MEVSTRLTVEPLRSEHLYWEEHETRR